jgi:hypothetical protein
MEYIGKNMTGLEKIPKNDLQISSKRKNMFGYTSDTVNYKIL